MKRTGCAVTLFLLVAPLCATAFALPSVDLENAVVDVASSVGKAVVSITTEQIARVPARRMYYSGPRGSVPFGEDEEFFQRFFSDFFGEIPYQEYRRRGSIGSGVIISPEGYILTNEHVVGSADKITVTLPDGRTFKAAVKGVDVRSDLAVIKIDAKEELPSAKLGDSESLKIGQWVVAIGNPFAFALQNPEPTVTTGVVSALHRSLGRTFSQDRDYNDLIQTDAAINPGNSGGPLVNLKGEVIGINVAIFSTSGGYQGIGFAVPANKARRILERLKAGKQVAYGWLGVTVQELNPDLAAYFGVAQEKGVLVSDVFSGSPAEKGGVRAGDVIVSFDGKEISSVRELLGAVAETDVGKTVKLGVVRENKAQTLALVLAERPSGNAVTRPASKGQKEEAQAPAGPWRGIEAGELDEAAVARRGTLRGASKVVVERVQPGSAAEQAGIIRGDVILEINKIPVTDLAKYRSAVAGAKGNALVRTARGYFLLK